ncbi:competence type IV pilus assembly protein ComGB [Bacillus tianshenii]|nr:competence type IV pilus assembly protein ComGB [Bacillus tianshenii]
MFRRKRWTIKQQADFLSKLARLLEKGYTLLHALELLKSYQKSHTKKDITEGLQALQAGSEFHVVLKKWGFSAYVTSYIYTSERQGDFVFSLRYSSNWLFHLHNSQKRFFNMLRYPVFLLFLLFGMVYFMQVMLFPQFDYLYQSMNHQLPPLTLFLLKLPKIIKWMLVILLLGLFSFWLFYRFYLQRLSVIKQISIWMKIPIFNQFLSLYFTHQYMMQFSNLLVGGLSVYNSLEIFSAQPYSKFLSEAASDMIVCLRNGALLSEIVESMPYFEKEAAVVIHHGQANGVVGKELQDYCEMVFEQMEKWINQLFRIVQPLLFTFIGLGVVVIFLGMMLPIFGLMNTI